DLSDASALLAWDQETHMPRGGAGARAHLQATLAGLRHAKLVAPELGDALARSAEEAELGSELAAEVREARRIVGRAVRIPERLARERAAAVAAGHEAWTAARARADFAVFRPALERIVALVREQARALSAPLGKDGAELYDALLDEYE